MSKHPHWLPQLIAKADKYNNAATKFLQNYILDHAVNGRIHAEIHPHRSEDSGAKSFRFSYSDPPLQQMTSRDKELAPLIRGVFLPEEGRSGPSPMPPSRNSGSSCTTPTNTSCLKPQTPWHVIATIPKADFHALAAAMTGHRTRVGQTCQFRQDLRRRREQVRGHDRQAARRSATD